MLDLGNAFDSLKSVFDSEELAPSVSLDDVQYILGRIASPMLEADIWNMPQIIIYCAIYVHQ